MSILVDWHGPADWDQPFEKVLAELSRSGYGIDIYFYQSTETGARTCRRACEMCFFRRLPQVTVPIGLATEVAQNLQRRGYCVGLCPADSLVPEVLTSGASGSAYRISGLGLTAWTAAAYLAGQSWESILEAAWAAGFRVLVINGQSVAGVPVPFKGVSTPEQIQVAVDRIRAWNSQRPEQRFKIGITFTIRSDHDYKSLRRMGKWAAKNGVAVMRFNCFANFRGLPQHDRWLLDRPGVERFYGWLARLHEGMIGSGVQLSVSEDFGDAGIEQIKHLMPVEYQGQQVGRCRSGRRLFALIQSDNKLVLTGCVDRLLPIMGQMVKRSDGWDIDWNIDVINRLAEIQVQRRFYGCWGGLGWGRKDIGFNDPEAEKYLCPPVAESLRSLLPLIRH